MDRHSPLHLGERKMNRTLTREEKEKWVAALRSGEYEQGFGKLEAEGLGGMRYCCLGVLCHILGYNSSSAYRIEYDSDEDDHDLINLSVQDSLIELNDTDQESFDEIANYIEKCSDI